MSLFNLTVHLGDFSQTCMLRTAEEAERLAAAGVYDGYGFAFVVEAENHLAAAEIAFGVCNSYPATATDPAELHCDPRYVEDVVRYRHGKNRSLSVGDMVMIRRCETWSRVETTDGRYVVLPAGFARF